MNLLAMIPCWLIPLLVGAICALLGYLLGRLFCKGNKKEDNNGNIDILKNRINKLEADLNKCNKDKVGLTKTLEEAKLDLKSCNKDKLKIASSLKDIKSENLKIASSFTNIKEPIIALIPFDADLSKSVFGKKIKENDLKVVEGIGPKIEGLFHTFGIKTWKDLGETSVEKCQEILKSGGDRYKLHKPNTWPKQAQLAYQGKWEELLKWQDELDGGR